MIYRTAAFTVLFVLFSSSLFAAGRLQMDDKAYMWPKANRSDKIDFTNRMGKIMVQLSPDLTNEYFLKCLEETTNIGNTKNLNLGDMVKTCISLNFRQSSE